MRFCNLEIFMNKACFAYHRLFLGVTLACASIMAQAQQSPFASQPFNLINETSTVPKYKNAKPNVMFLIDDSGSMVAEVGFDRTREPELCDFLVYYFDPSRNRTSRARRYLNMAILDQGFYVPETTLTDCQRIIVGKEMDSDRDVEIFYNSSINPLSSVRVTNVVPRLPEEASNASRYLRRLSNLFNGAGGFTVSSNVDPWKIYYKSTYPDGSNISEGTRMDVTKNSLKKVLNEYQGYGINWSLLTLSGSENPNKSKCTKGNERSISDLRELGMVHPFSDNVEYLLGKINELNYVSKSSSGTCHPWEVLTPSTIRYVAAAKILAEEANQIKEGASNEELMCSQNYLIMFADGDANYSPNLPGKYDDYKNLEPYSNFYPSLPRGYSYNGANGISFFSDALYRKDIAPNVEGLQNIQTYTIGFGDSLTDQGRAYLKNAAQADKIIRDKDGIISNILKPSEQGSDKYGYFSASNTEELDNAFAEIFGNVIAQSESVPADTISTVTPGNTSTTSSSSAALLTLNTLNWSSRLQFYRIDNMGKLQSNTPEDATFSSSRTIVVRGKSGVYSLNKNMNSQALSYAQSDFGFENAEELKSLFIPWLLRSNTDIQIIQNADKVQGTRKIENYRNRLAGSKYFAEQLTDADRQMGDVLNSSLTAIKLPNASRYVLTGANDGMVYIFEESAGAYSLKMNYLPSTMLREHQGDTLGQNLYRLAQANYGSTSNPHMYGVNAPISYTRSAKTAGRAQRTIALGGLGQGGRGVYALDIDQLSRNDLLKVPLWDTSNGISGVSDEKDERLGYVMGSPVIYQVALAYNSFQNKPVIENNVFLAAFVNNGFSFSNSSLPADNAPSLYVYAALPNDMGTRLDKATTMGMGELIYKFSVEDADAPIYADGKNALAAPVLVDVNFDGVADVAYAGDYAGDLYRFDLRGGVNAWNVKKIYDGDPSQPITAAPAIYRKNDKELIVVFGTGSDLFDRDLATLDDVNDWARKPQGVFAIFDVISDENGRIQEAKVVQKEDLVKRDLKTYENAGKGDMRKLAVDPRDPREVSKGWWFELAEGSALNPDLTKAITAEKVVSQPTILLSTAFLSTRIYEYQEDGRVNVGTEQCPVNRSTKRSGGTSWLMAFDVRTGLTPSTARFTDIEEDYVGVNLGYLASAATLLNGGSLVAEMPSAINDNAQVQDGEQKDLQEAAVIGNNTCVTSSEYFLLLALADKNDPLRNLAVSAPICPNPGILTRINLREVEEGE